MEKCYLWFFDVSMKWPPRRGVSRFGCGPMDCVSQSSPGTGDFQQVNVNAASCKSLCIAEMFLLFSCCTCFDKPYLITQIFSCFPSGLL